MSANVRCFNGCLLTDGCSSIWPEINVPFLSLKGVPEAVIAQEPTQAIFRSLLKGFDAITGCELKDIYKFARYLNAISEDMPAELINIVRAFRKWVEFDYVGARSLFQAHLHAYPTDVQALFFIHMLDFCTGRTAELKPLFALCDEYMEESHPLYSFYLSIKSFVLCECGLFDESLATGLESVRYCSANIYGIHAVAHALHEKGMWVELRDFLEDSKEEWIRNPGMRMHVYWHLAITYKQLGNHAAAKMAFLEFYALKNDRFSKQDLDAVGFLWRFKLEDVNSHEFDEVWKELAILWSGSIATSTSHFHNMHAAFAFAGANQPLLIEKMMAESDGFGIEPDAHLAGLDIIRAIALFARGHYEECYYLLTASRHQWTSLGGSRAQRELLDLTLNFCKAHVQSQAELERLMLM
ncbi:tetratricopeptide repeat protein [Pseudomonas sp. MAG002Y]|uniref:tetratricopeptide repeat protein n=1 Tax=Pseudomonas TaxID=286 RepID=UPI001C608E5D|nr:tetratricopeptide repeat protein [Pseudomonas sp. MAG002Y]MBW5412916.1 tetratricopeptide repeat protein [Pseudomonas sp. MAG002Y]